VHNRYIIKTSLNRIPQAKKNNNKRIIASVKVIYIYIKVAVDKGRLMITLEIIGILSLYFYKEIASII
jgi:hypothetical protein